MRDSSLCHLFTLVCNLHTILIIIFTTTDAAPVYLDSKCSNKTCFGPNSTYQTNLNVVFQSLTSNAAITTTGFHFTATGNGTDNAVYGLFLCRGDQNTTSCRDCVSVAAEDLPRSYCPGKKQAIIWYNECMVRYSNENVLGKMEESPKLLIWNSLNVSRSQTTFADILNNEMKILVVEASSDQSGKKFAAKVVNLTRSQILFATVQCTPDLTEADCTRCLKTAVSQLSIGVSGKILQPSCNAFYQVGLPHFVDSITARKQIGKKQSISKVIIVVIGPITAVLAAMMAFNLLNKRSKNCIVQVIDSHQLQGGMQSLQYDLETLDQATNNFSSVNVIGVGRHGCVYKGTLPNGLEVAVKKLRQSYGQHLSLQLLEDEMLSLAKLQHRNLVKFHGFCLDGVEKLLVYEYVPNKSLDNYLYDHLPHKRLGWESRYQIICGIARGIHYLHQDSQLRIIHGDLKLESVLLDAHMNPKLSDFSLTKIISNGQIENEYSIRSDIYKFGVLLFEVISGKNDYFLSRMYDYGLLEYAWKQWIGGTPLEFVDSKIRDAYSSDQVIRCMHIGFLCIQPDTDDNEKPTMASIVLMLDNSTITLPPPAEPAFFFSSEVEPINKAEPSVNKISITDLDPR